jgi:hypothetical protein
VTIDVSCVPAVDVLAVDVWANVLPSEELKPHVVVSTSVFDSDIGVVDARVGFLSELTVEVEVFTADVLTRKCVDGELTIDVAEVTTVVSVSWD